LSTGTVIQQKINYFLFLKNSRFKSAKLLKSVKFLESVKCLKSVKLKKNEIYIRLHLCGQSDKLVGDFIFDKNG